MKVLDFFIMSFLLVTYLAGCATPSTVSLPSGEQVEQRRIEVSDLADLPPPITRVMVGDTLRIVRDAQSPAERDEATLFYVRPDGTFAYPFIGTVKGTGRTPEEIGSEITERLADIYRYPKVTVNIALAPGNRVFVGGAVRNPSAFELSAALTVEHAIIGAGGVLPTADSLHIALLRMNENGTYNVYFSDFSRFLHSDGQRRAVVLQRGDVVFVPKSAVGNGIEMVDLYLNQLIPFSKGIGLGLNYNLNNPNTDNNVSVKAN